MRNQKTNTKDSDATEATETPYTSLECLDLYYTPRYGRMTIEEAQKLATTTMQWADYTSEAMINANELIEDCI